MPNPIVCWDRNLVDAFFRVEATSVVNSHGWDAFNKLHYPISRIRVVRHSVAGLDTFEDELPNGESGLFIHEQEVLRCIEEARPDGRTLIGIRGAAGSGKSHLIKWLEGQLRDRYITVAIPREINSVGKILNKLKAVVGKQGQYRTDSDTDYDKLAKAILATMQFQGASAKGSVGALLSKPNLLKTLIDGAIEKYRVYTRSGSDHFGKGAVAAIPEDALRQVHQYHLRRKDDPDAFIADIQQRFTSAWTTNVLGGPVDIEAELSELIEFANGRRIVLLIEDVTSFQFLQRDLFYAVSTEAAPGPLVTVMGWTPAYEESAIAEENLRQRIALHVSLTERKSSQDPYETLTFRRREEVLGLADRYLSAIRKCSRGCQQSCAAGIDKYYPFTEEGLWRIYRNMEDAQDHGRVFTPREFLRTMREILQSTSNGVFPWLHRPAFLREITPDPNLEHFRTTHPQYVTTAAWMLSGREDSEAVKRYLKSLDIEPPGGDSLPSVTPGHGPNARSTAAPGPTVGPATDEVATGGPANHADPRERKWDVAVQQLARWREGSSTLASSYEWAELVWKTLKQWGQDAPSVYGLQFTDASRGTSVVYIEDAADRSARHEIVIPRNDVGEHVLRALKYREIYGQWQTPLEAAYARSRLHQWHKEACSRLRASLIQDRPVLGFLGHLLHWRAAFDGRIGRSGRSDLRAILSPRSGSAAQPLLAKSGPLVTLQQALNTHSALLDNLLPSISSRSNHILDLHFVIQSIEAYPARHRNARRAAESLRTAHDNIGPAMKQCAAAFQAVAQEQEPYPEAEEYQKLANRAATSTALGTGFSESMAALREAFGRLAGSPVAANTWTPLSNQYLSPEDERAADEVLERFRTQAPEILREKDRKLRLSKMTRLEPRRVQAILDTADAAAQILWRVKQQVDQARKDAGTSQASSDVANAIAALETLRAVLGGRS